MNTRPSIDCPERRRLTNILAEAINAVSALRETEKNDPASSNRLEQLSTAMRDAEKALDQHINQHGCLQVENISTAKPSS